MRGAGGSGSGRVTLTGHIDVPAERLAEVEAALPRHIELTRAETGCLKFEVVSCPSVAGRFLVSEMFVDRQAFDAHQERTKASDWARVTHGIERDYSVTIEGEDS